MSTRHRFTMKDFSAELAVGLFFFFALAILAYFTIILSKDTLFKTTWERQARFPSVAGLSEGDAIRIRGVVVGSVRRIALTDGEVRVNLVFDKDIGLYAGTTAEVGFSSILGGRYVVVNPGKPEQGRLPENAVIEGLEPADIFAEVTNIAQTLRDEIGKITKVFDENDVFPKAAQLVDDISAISADLRAGKGTLGRLLKDDTLFTSATDMVDAVKDAGAGVKVTAASLNEVITAAREGQGTIGKLLNDDAVYQDFQGILADLREGKGTLGKLITDDSLHADIAETAANLRTTSASLRDGKSTAGRIFNDDGRLYESIAATFENTQSVTAELRAGRGTIGKLLQDEALYQDLRGTINELRSAIEDFREQAPISTFGSFVFGAL